jgi:glycosyltransferase involved in cell wall biosynthesis
MAAAQIPWLATVIPVLNEEHHIENCLSSLITQTLPSSEHMILVVDGGSIDSTVSIVKNMIYESKKTNGPVIVLLHNENRYVPHARNMALSNLSEGITHVLEYNGHIKSGPEHLLLLKSEWERIAKQYPSMAALGCKVVGSSNKNTIVESFIDETLQNPLGGGPGQFSTFTEEGETKTPAFSLHLRSALEKVRGWDEQFITSQDSDLSMRLIKEGFTLHRTPGIMVEMRRRTSIKSWYLMSHRYGFWRTKVLLKHPSRIVLREFLPLLGTLITIGLFLVNLQWGFIPLLAYSSVLLLSGLYSSRKGISNIVGVPLCLLILHIGFTIGLLDGCVRKGRASRDR